MRNVRISPIKQLCRIIPLIVVFNGALAQTRDEALMAQAIERFRLAMIHPDSAVLADLSCEDLQYVHSSGTVRNKKGFIDEFMLRQTDVSSVTFSDQTIKISGDNAIVRHRLIADSKKLDTHPLLTSLF